MQKKDIGGDIPSNKCMNDDAENKESSYLKCQDVNNLYGWAMAQKIPLGGFKWVKETCTFNEDFIKSYNNDRKIGCFIEAGAYYPKELLELHTG